MDDQRLDLEIKRFARKGATIPAVLQAMYKDVEDIDVVSEQAIKVIDKPDNKWVDFLRWVQQQLSTRVEPEAREGFLLTVMTVWGFTAGMRAGQSDTVDELIDALTGLGNKGNAVAFNENGDQISV